MDEYIWPARNVAEYAYCPRLFYLMEVEGIHLPSADTEQGHAVHQRVDQPTSRESEIVDSAPETVRSLTLTDNQLLLTATLDLAEIDGNTAIPVEYRKGRPRRAYALDKHDAGGEDEKDPQTTVTPWPTDRVQIGLQAMLLESAGYTVPHGVIYYAAERRRLEIAIDDAVRNEALATLDFARTCAKGPRPLPLVNDVRCVGCSLQPICLPDEVNYERHVQASPRRLWPPRDDAMHVVAQQEGVHVGIDGMALRFSGRDRKKIREIPLAGLESLTVLGNVQLSTQAIHSLCDRGISVAYLSGAGRMIALVDPLDSVSAQVRRAQVRVLDDQSRCIELCRALVKAKVINQRTLLMRNCSGLTDTAAQDLSNVVSNVDTASGVESLRGYEGQAAAIYFKHFAGMIKDLDTAGSFHENGRQRRPPPDPINTVLSFAYTMLTHEAVAALRTARLEPSIGAYHVSRPRRPALALDLMEPFRPLIADSIAVAAFNRGELTQGHFVQTAAGCAMTEHGRRAFFGVYGRRMDTEVTHPVFGYKLSYRRMIMLHARMIAAWVLGEVSDLAFLTTR